MVGPPTALARALALSLLLHALALAATSRLVPQPRDPRSMAAALSVWLRQPPPEPVAAPSPPPAASPLPPLAPTVSAKVETNASAERPRRAPAPRVSPKAAAVAIPKLSGEAARAARAQLAQGLLYPLEAVERGMEGEATVLLFLDDAGNVIASRLESSSGYALLDDAALAAARGLRGLPDSAPREALLPVRFRLAR